jgi:hypothetical protein
LYEFNGVLIYLFDNKLYLVSVILIWITIVVYYAQIVIKYEGSKVNNNKNKNVYEKVRRLKE